MRSNILVLISLFLLFNSRVFAAWDKKPQLRLNQLYNYDWGADDHLLYTARLSVISHYLDSNGKPLFKLSPFYEARRNIKRCLWERQELGMEIGKDIFPWLYLGEAIQGTWLKEDYRLYTKNKTRRPFESKTRVLFSCNLLSNSHLKINSFLLGEYTYDLDIGAGTRNEVAAGVTIPVGKHLETVINWRHIDRIHDFDSDAVEASATLIF